MADRVKIAVIGTGLIGPRHARSVLSCPDALLLCVVDPSLNAKNVAVELAVPLFSSVHAMLQVFTPDAAIVCVPNSMHVTISSELLNAGVNVLVEKPIATTIETGKQVVETARLSGKHLLSTLR